LGKIVLLANEQAKYMPLVICFVILSSYPKLFFIHHFLLCNSDHGQGQLIVNYCEKKNSLILEDLADWGRHQSFQL